MVGVHPGAWATRRPPAISLPGCVIHAPDVIISPPGRTLLTRTLPPNVKDRLFDEPRHRPIGSSGICNLQAHRAVAPISAGHGIRFSTFEFPSQIEKEFGSIHGIGRAQQRIEGRQPARSRVESSTTVNVSSVRTSPFTLSPAYRIHPSHSTFLMVPSSLLLHMVGDRETSPSTAFTELSGAPRQVKVAAGSAEVGSDGFIVRVVSGVCCWGRGFRGRVPRCVIGRFGRPPGGWRG